LGLQKIFDDKLLNARYQISAEGLRAIRDYVENERKEDAAAWESPALFLPASTVSQSSGRLAVNVVNGIWNEVAELAGVEGKTPHSARHAMGRHLIEKIGNIAAVQRQLGHNKEAHSSTPRGRGFLRRLVYDQRPDEGGDSSGTGSRGASPPENT